MIKLIKTLPLILFLTSTNSLAALKLIPVENRKGNLILEKDPKALVSNFHIVIKTGSVHDPKGKVGLTALSFEALLRGTKNKSKSEFFAELEQLGATVSMDVSYSRTIISLDAISKNLKPAIKLLSEAVLQPGLKKKEIAKLLEEHKAKLMQSRSNIRSLLSHSVRKFLYEGTPLENHYNGSIPSVNKIRLTDIKKRLRNSLNSNNIIFAVNTNLEKNNIKKWIKKYFAVLPNGTVPSPINLSNFKKRKGIHFLILPAPKSSKTVNVILTPIQVGPKADFKDWHILSLGTFAFSRGMSSILFNELREKTGWTYTAYGDYRRFDLPRYYGSNFLILTSPATIYAKKAIPRALELYEQYVKNGLTKKQFGLASDAIKDSYAFKFAQAEQRLANRIYSTLDGAKIDPISLFHKKIDSLEPKDLKNLLQKTENTKDTLIAVTGDPEQMKKILSEAFPHRKKSFHVVKDPITGK